MASSFSGGWGDSDDDTVDFIEGLTDWGERTVYGGSNWFEELTSSGKGFRFPSVEDADKLINNFKDRRDSIKGCQGRIDRARDALRLPFASDHASQGYVSQALDSLERLAELNESALAYANHYIEKLEKAKKAKHDQDDELASSFVSSERNVG
ncbi:hypothetical protein [Haloechinothrix salitolerans]|uniref:Uncharacterized protein n=1 Tax=Haloechinothrix salitolerans TaxID=926830 RepID=A0ABW2C949_9PSEU